MILVMSVLNIHENANILLEDCNKIFCQSLMLNMHISTYVSSSMILSNLQILKLLTYYWIFVANLTIIS